MAQLNYNHLRYFWAVAHEGNLTRAAQHLNVSQSALSVQIQKLEAQLGQALFERRGKQLQLTEAGRIALAHADAIFKSGDEMLSTLKGATRQRQVLRMGALSTLSRNFQIGFLKPLLGRADVEIVIRSGSMGELLQQLEAFRLDVLLSTTPPPRDAATPWVAHPVADQPVSLVGAPPGRKKKRPLEQMLREEPLILPTAESSIRAGFDALAERLGIRPTIAAEVDDMAMLRLLARERIGLAVVPPIVVTNELESGMLAELHRFEELAEHFYAITPSRRFPHPLLKLLVPKRSLKA
ncbi:LysR family transcriptional regulator [Aestuariivirga sp.]|uniref:LysR family transcriptional regulator n=1 Tax=Aestuariivirga sp. TaxID=2650926 RepID=UPI00391AA7F9